VAENKKALLRRKKAVQSAMKVTKSLKMVSAAKLRRAQNKVQAARPYARALAQTLSRLAGSEAAKNVPLLQQREEVKTVCYVIITSDRGQAGPYNANIIRRAQLALREEKRDYKLIFIGRKALAYFRRRGYVPFMEFTGIGDDPSFAQIKEITHKIVDLFLSGQVDEIRLIFSEFVNAITQRPTQMTLVPVPREAALAVGLPKGKKNVEVTALPAAAGVIEYIYVPDEGAVLSVLVPKIVDTMFYQSILESKAAEQGARMTAMGNATDNAEELLSTITLSYNKARQAGITREISEIVGGSEALK
jgi:F-type H+-transporting ATPase subunit gamma